MNYIIIVFDTLDNDFITSLSEFMKKIVIFDLDNTLAESKQKIQYNMVETLKLLLQSVMIGIISGGSFDQFKKQVLEELQPSENEASRIHLLPTSGTQYYRYLNNQWTLIYKVGMEEDDINKIWEALEKVIKEEGINKMVCFGERIENRGNSQITFSGYGQSAPLDIKSKFDPDKSIRLRMKQKLDQLLPEFNVRIGGTSSIDITKPGIDKSFGINRLIEHLGLQKNDILYIGDELEEAGNDYPVKSMGIECIKTTGPANTIEIIKNFIF